jgi:hypothetical protein
MQRLSRAQSLQVLDDLAQDRTDDDVLIDNCKARYAVKIARHRREMIAEAQLL